MKKELTAALVWAGAMIAVALVAAFAHKLGYIDGDTGRRLLAGLNGLWLAWFGNRMPKALAPTACARKVKRLGGWSLVLSGLVYAGLWLFAPIPVAVAVGCAVLLSGMAVTLGYVLWLRVGPRVA